MKKYIVLLLSLCFLPVMAKENIDESRKEIIYEAAYAKGFNQGFQEELNNLKKVLKNKERELDNIFNPQLLMIETQYGLVLPPLVTNGNKNFTYSSISSQIYKNSPSVLYVKKQVKENNKIQWRDYLLDSLDDNSLLTFKPIDTLNKEEEAYYDRNVRRGRVRGKSVINSTFESNMDQLLTDWQGIMWGKDVYIRGLITVDIKNTQ